MTATPWTEPTISGINREAAHAPWGAYANADAARRADRAIGPWSLSLDGTWRFHLAPQPEAVPAGFERPEFDDAGWCGIPVPANWEVEGHGNPVYVNVAYPFHADPPRLPADNPTGCYRRHFDLPATWDGRRVFIHFGAAESGLQVFCNGREVGYSEDAKLPAEFELTPFLKPGRNLIAAKVLRFCTGSYLEDQDYWHVSGLQRPVTLFAKPAIHLRDWRVQTRFDAVYRDATLDLLAWVCRPQTQAENPWHGITWPELKDWTVEAELFDPAGKAVLAAPVKAPLNTASGFAHEPQYDALAAHIQAPVAAPQVWTAETPALYTLVLTLRDAHGAVVDIESSRVGFRQIEIHDGQVKLNGRRLIVRGVNRHEWNPVRGRAVTVADMRADILAMKRLNFNAVRTCHYPDDPRWLDLCDELGMYLVAETDLETHGVGSHLTLHPAWAAAYLERAVRMVLRDRNHPAVCFWSLGNESIHGPHHAAMAAWIRNTDPTRPVQYESGDPPATISDILCPMYPGLEWVRQRLARAGDSRPMIMCEYAYGKGNTLGLLYRFWETVELIPRFQGGFMWDWSDKSLVRRQLDGRLRHTYGEAGREGKGMERMCLNGVVDPDLVPHPAAHELKQVQAPVRFVAVDAAAGKLAILNRHLVLDCSQLVLDWELRADGARLTGGSLPCPAIAPGGRHELTLPVAKPGSLVPGAEYWLTVTARTAAATVWAEAGHVISAQQFALPWAATAPLVPLAGMPAVSASEQAGRIAFRTPTLAGAVCRRTGRLVSLAVGGRELLLEPLRPCLWRAPTDLDEPTGERWQAAGLDRLVETVTGLACTSLSPQLVRIRVGTSLAAPGLPEAARRETVYLVHGSGDIVVDETLRITADVPTLPRIGLRLALAAGCDQVRWYGRGPWENYRDRSSAAQVGDYRSSLADLLPRYVFPQEGGTRSEVRWAAVTDADGCGLLVQGQPTLAFAALPVPVEQLTACMNRDELKPGGGAWLHLDGWHAVIDGDHAWGGNQEPDRRLVPGRYRWQVRLRPLARGDDPAAIGRGELEGAPR